MGPSVSSLPTSERGQRRDPAAGRRDRLGHAHARIAGSLLDGWQHASVAHANGQPIAEPVDVLLADGESDCAPSLMFDQLRWGGHVLYVGRGGRRSRALADAMEQSGAFTIERPNLPVAEGLGRLVARLTPFGAHGFVARKTRLILPGDTSDRFSHDIRLEPDPTAPYGYVVTKSVPSREQVYQQIKSRHPELDDATVDGRIHKLCDHVFPTFLTREAAILQILRHGLPPEYRLRVPALVSMHRNSRGFVEKFSMTWLRVGGQTLSQLEFARQAMDLTRVMHDHAGVMHMDLRMDNMVITPRGVCFIDFGSAVKIGENFDQSPMLISLFGEMLRASQMQQLLRRMKRCGQVTRDALTLLDGRIDRLVDCFYLALQFDRPHDNPDLAPFIRHDSGSKDAVILSQITRQFLQWTQGDEQPYNSAARMLEACNQLADRPTRSRREAALAGVGPPSETARVGT